MEKIGFEQVKTLLDGTRVFVRCTGSEWNLNELESWNIKHDDGLYYEDESEGISFPYDFDYHANNMDIECFVGDTGWRYFIVLLTDNCYGNFVEAAEDLNGELPVCVDVSVAKSFYSVDALLSWVSKYTSLKVENCDYKIEGQYLPVNL